MKTFMPLYKEGGRMADFPAFTAPVVFIVIVTFFSEPKLWDRSRTNFKTFTFDVLMRPVLYFWTNTLSAVRVWGTATPRSQSMITDPNIEQLWI